MRQNFNIFKGIVFLCVLGVFIGGYVLYSKIYNLPVEKLRIGVVYPKNIKTKSILYEKFENCFEQARQKIHDEFLLEEKKLRLQFESLKKTGKKSKKVEQEKDILLERAKELENTLIAKKDDFLQKTQRLTAVLQEKLDASIRRVADHKAIELVLNAEADEKILVLYCHKSLDITAEVIEEINKEKVDFEILLGE